ncbi:MAG: MoaD/ThiS family protein [Pseudomonadota bacterium]
MKLRVRYFASLREALGPGEEVELAEGATLGALRDALVGRGGRHAEMLARGRAGRGAVEQVWGDDGEALRDGAGGACFPPVTGG